MSTELIAIESDDEDITFDFHTPEVVVFEIIPVDNSNSWSLDWRGYHIDGATVISGNEKPGAASYAEWYGCGIDYVIMDILECPKEYGFFVIDGIEADFRKGDGWEIEDDMDFYIVGPGLRKATEDEIALY